MQIPDNMVKHIEKIFNGEYDIPYENPNPVILDIGGNVGGFCLWANKRWANSKIYSYEPIKNNFNLLKENTKDIDNIMPVNVAVGSKTETRKMYYGLNNIGECSFKHGVEQIEDGEDVSVFSASLLPKANIVKIDTEGAEIEILENILNPIEESTLEDIKIKMRKKKLTKSDFKDFKVFTIQDLEQ